MMACKQKKATDLVNLLLKHGANVHSQLTVRGPDTYNMGYSQFLNYRMA